MGRNARAFSTALVAAGACSALALGAGPAGAAVAGTAHGAAGTPHAAPARSLVPVIIFLKDQWPGTAAEVRSPRRAALIQAAQAPYVRRLQALGATSVLRYQLVDAIAAHVPAAAVGSLAASPQVASVIPDSPISRPAPAASTAAPTAPGPAATPADAKGAAAKRALPKAVRPNAVSARSAAPKTTAPATTAPATTGPKAAAGACSASPQLTPETLSLTGTDSTAKGTRTARSLGYTGAGVKVAFLAGGIDPRNPNLMRAGHPVISDYRDFTGDGTSAPTAGGTAFTDASLIAGQGSAVYDVAGFGAQSPAAPCKIRIEGMAPGASLVALKVFGRQGTSTTSGYLRAIDYAVSTGHVNVLEESFGPRSFSDVTSLDAVREFNDMAVAAGTTVVLPASAPATAGGAGSPASDPQVISVGASTDFQFYAQAGYAGANTFAPHGWENDNVSALSPAGYASSGATLDLVAPGDRSFASCTAVPARYSSCVSLLGKPSPVEMSAGTSAAAPAVAGAAALVIQAYARQHHGALPSPAVVKQVLLSTATDLGAPAAEQGSGLLNSLRAVELASWLPGRTPAGPALQLSANQLNDTGKPGSAVSWPVTVTNAAGTRQTVTVSGRAFSAGSVVKQATVTLPAGTQGPHFTTSTGAPASYGTVQFAVPRGAALLNASVAWPASVSARGASTATRLILVDPAGKLAADSLAPGASGYGGAQVLRPAAGNWTAVISSSSGSRTAVQFGASVSHAEPFATVSPAKLVLAPGASGTVHVSARVPTGAGETAGSVVFATGAGGAGPVSVPVTLRGQVQPGLAKPAAFSGTLGGGDGRAPGQGQGQVEAYQVVVPGNLPVLLGSLDVSLNLASEPAGQVSASLVAPGGETMGFGSSYLTTGFGSGGVPVESPQRTLSLYASDPVPGTWTLLVGFTSPVPGGEPPDSYTGQVSLNALPVSRGGLPDSPSATLKAGKAVTFPVTVHNTGSAPEDIFLDPRLTQLQSYQLQPQDRVAGVPLPVPATADPPEWIVPTMTHSVSASASAAVPVKFSLGPFPGDLGAASDSGTTTQAAYPQGRAVTPVTPGLWLAMPAESGPFGPAGAPKTAVTASMSAVTQRFDTSATPSTGDFWRFAVAALAPHASYNLLVVNPGQTRTVNLTVQPAAPRGTVVHGVLYVDDFVDSMQFLSGSQLAALPYAYTVG